MAMLWHCWETCDGWSDLLAEKHMQNPSSIDSPWSLILYTDEVTPGDVNATAPTRKVQTIYWSFKELGHAILCKEDAWFCALVLRSSTCRSFVAGGLAQTMGALLKTFFPAVGTNLQHTGMFLSKNGTEFRLFAKLAIVVQDGAAHKEFWSCRDGTRLCMKCLTVEASSELSDIDPSLKSNVLKVDELETTTDASCKDTARRLSWWAGRENNGTFTRRQQLMGFTHMQYSLLTDMTLDGIIQPCSQFMHDWMHGLFSKGVFQVCLYLLLTSMEEANLHTLLGGATGIYQYLYEYIKPWKFPAKRKCTDLYKVFDPKRRQGNRDAETFRCGASEGLALVQILSFWVSALVLPLGLCILACQAFIAFADIAECMVTVATGTIPADTLKSAIETFLEKFVQAFGASKLTPKLHWLLHSVEELADHGTLFSCFVHERKHKMIKRYANPVLNTRARKDVGAFEVSVLSEVTSHHLHVLTDGASLSIKPGLVNPYKAKASTMSTLEELFGSNMVDHVASAARFNEFETCGVGDVVLVRGIGGHAFVAAQVWVHVSVQGQARSILSCWTLKAFLEEHHAAEWLIAENPMVVNTEDIMSTVTWMNAGGNAARTLLPAKVL